MKRNTQVTTEPIQAGRLEGGLEHTKRDRMQEAMSSRRSLSRELGRAASAILETIAESPRYGFTDRDLVGHVYEAYDDEITEAQIVAVRRAVRALLAEGVVVERPQVTEHLRIASAAPVPARPRGSAVRLRAPRVAAPVPAWLQCVPCDVQWQHEDAELCWSCGKAGVPHPRPT